MLFVGDLKHIGADAILFHPASVGRLPVVWNRVRFHTTGNAWRHSRAHEAYFVRLRRTKYAVARCVDRGESRAHAWRNGGNMARFDRVIRGGMIVDGSRLPRFRGDIGIKDGRIA